MRRPNSFEERRAELTASIAIITNALLDSENSGATHPLRTVAVQLRAFLVDEHPLLLELATERSFPLTVYSTSQAYTEKVLALKPVFYSTGDALSVAKDEMFTTPIDLRDALALLHVKLDDE